MSRNAQTRLISQSRSFGKFACQSIVGFVTENEKKPGQQVQDDVLAMAKASMSAMALGKPILTAPLHEVMRHTACIFDIAGPSIEHHAASLTVAEETAASLKTPGRRKDLGNTLATYWQHLMVSPATKAAFDAVRNRVASQAEFVAASKLLDEVKSSVGAFNALSLAEGTDFADFHKQALSVPMCCRYLFHVFCLLRMIASCVLYQSVSFHVANVGY